MKDRLVTFSFCDNLLDNLLAALEERYLRSGRDLRQLAIVFGGKRPALFLKKALGARLGRNYFPPRFFTIDQWMADTVFRQEPFTPARDLDQSYLLYQLTRSRAPHLLKPGRATFAQFLPWAQEMLHFIEQLDLELVPSEDLHHIQANAQIGYAVPPPINQLLQSLIVLREAYHRHMLDQREYSRGFQYFRAADLAGQLAAADLEHVWFCNFFYLNRCEQRVIKTLYDQEQATLFFQGDERKWPVFQRTARLFETAIREGAQPDHPQFALKLYAGFDVHSQAGLVRKILQGIREHQRTVIVLPEADHLIPLLSEIGSELGEFNISMGYPLRRSAICALLDLIFRAQLSRRGLTYYSRDYLRLLRHPLIKNLSLGQNPAVTRILVHKIEEMLTGQLAGALSGQLYLELSAVEQSAELFPATVQTLSGMGIAVTSEAVRTMLGEIHSMVLRSWEGLGTFSRLADALQQFVPALEAKSFLHFYPLNVKVAKRILEIQAELAGAAFSGEAFEDEELFRIFSAKVDREIVAFQGSPLKGLQILGLFETRSLNFDHVIVLDVNEGTLPRLNIYEPLIPREVMIGLNLDRLEQEEEIQRYQFMRLISAAKTVHLVYQESRDKERSRFVEELIWEEQKQRQRLDVLPPVQSQFDVKLNLQQTVIRKTPAMLEFLRGHRYSASSLNLYLRSPVDFYYNYVLGLRDKEDLLDEPENRQVGTFLHQLLEEAFRPLVGRRPEIDAPFQQHFLRTLDERFMETLARSMKADAFLLKSVLDARMRRFLENEADSPERRVREILFIEQQFHDKITLSCGEINFVYRVDRVDRMEDGSVMILDYKTGSVDPMPKAIDSIESMRLSRETVLENVRSFQIPLYFHYLERFFRNERVNAAFYNLRTLELHKFIDQRMRYDRERIQAAFRRVLDFVMSELLDPDIDFCDEDGRRTTQEEDFHESLG